LRYRRLLDHAILGDYDWTVEVGYIPKDWINDETSPTPIATATDTPPILHVLSRRSVRALRRLRRLVVVVFVQRMYQYQTTKVKLKHEKKGGQLMTSHDGEWRVVLALNAIDDI